ncbi:MAG: SipW-dependent-type signal peptide-containing protein [Dehalococcoidia bacterium]|nr:SipW-dependent-type signal peptide-containing protein [Dehalococcoidia bacterium]MCB9484610.1 hypothetical protein [Thermoflexaceae bacterium]
MKKILLSMMLLGAISAIVLVATGASFSDTVTSDGNTFTAGTLYLSVDGNCGPAPDAQPRTSGATVCSRGVSFSASGIKPGDPATTKAIVIKNVGSIAGSLTSTQTVSYSDSTNCGAANWTISSAPAVTALAAGASTTYNASVQLNAAAGNGCQGQSATVNMSFSIS